MEVFGNAYYVASNTFLCSFRKPPFDRRNLDDNVLPGGTMSQRPPNHTVSPEATDVDALTPNHFLLGTASSTLPSHFRPEIDHRRQNVRAQAYSDAIWNRWLKEYVPHLNRRSEWFQSSDRHLKTGDLVWLVEPTAPRGHYPLGRVVKLNYGTDTIARSAEVKTSTGNVVRSVVKLAPVLPISE